MKQRWARLLAVLPAVTLAVGLTTPPASAHTSPLPPRKPFGLPHLSPPTAPLLHDPLGAPLLRSSAERARPPWAATNRGWNDFSCEPSYAHPRPVVLVHGTFANGVNNWLGLAPYLVRRGYCVFSPTYGQLPVLPFVGGLGPIHASARQLAAYVHRVLAATGARKVDIVGHSQGGMMPRVYLKYYGGRHKVHTLVGIAPDNRGTDEHGLTKLLDAAPAVKNTLHGLTPGLIEQEAGSPLLRHLNAGGDTLPGIHYTVIASRYDEVITPHWSQFLHGRHVHNIEVQELCPLDFSLHAPLGLLDPVAWHETANALDPEHATATTCASALR
ncbi:esterase/lipase family protein [Streptomyces sp. WZ-12]|uniref:esterase/lipase family protein n=1 Tax=Streptomyces sp. WZ-12 TaxID=3030210 RepID=UPI0023818D4F|nr:alpha/beta fold hydrolase [Streptomyces sp. WZ-12]